MARMARVVVPGYPHHVTQRGNRKEKTFFDESDYRAYLRMVANAKRHAEVDVWAYCLMPNHVHLVVVPEKADSLARLFKDAHRRYTLRINKKKQWVGHLWQERFHSVPMDEAHLLAAVRYVEMNPVRAGLCATLDAWCWSSVHAHRRRVDDLLVSVEPMLQRVDNWDGYVGTPTSASSMDAIRRHTRTGRPVGSKQFIDELERITGRDLHMGRPGRKPGNR